MTAYTFLKDLGVLIRNLPPLSPPLYWTNWLAVDGTVRVASTGLPGARVTIVNSTNVLLSGTMTPGITTPIYVYASPAIAPPTWTPIATNFPDGSGYYNIFLTGAVQGPQRFFVLAVP